MNAWGAVVARREARTRRLVAYGPVAALVVLASVTGSLSAWSAVGTAPPSATQRLRALLIPRSDLPHDWVVAATSVELPTVTVEHGAGTLGARFLACARRPPLTTGPVAVYDALAGPQANVFETVNFTQDRSATEVAAAWSDASRLLTRCLQGVPRSKQGQVILDQWETQARWYEASSQWVQTSRPLLARWRHVVAASTIVAVSAPSGPADETSFTVVFIRHGVFGWLSYVAYSRIDTRFALHMLQLAAKRL